MDVLISVCRQVMCHCLWLSLFPILSLLLFAYKEPPPAPHSMPERPGRCAHSSRATVVFTLPVLIQHCEVRVWTVSALLALGVPVFVGIEDHLSSGCLRISTGFDPLRGVALDPHHFRSPVRTHETVGSDPSIPQSFKLRHLYWSCWNSREKFSHPGTWWGLSPRCCKVSRHGLAAGIANDRPMPSATAEAKLRSRITHTHTHGKRPFQSSARKACSLLPFNICPQVSYRSIRGG